MVQKTQDAYLSKPQLADYLSVSARTVNEFMKQGLPHYRVGSKILRYKRSEVDAWFERFRSDEDHVDRIVNEILG